MAYIPENTEIVLCRDIPLDSSYENTLTFNSKQSQLAYFYSKRYKVIPANSYQRTFKGTLRIECTIEEAMMCNYLYFTNTNFENRTFFAFITSWRYVNNVTTEISYKIDAFQTFWFDVRLLDTFVEREHTNNDSIGANLVEENLATGDYILSNYTTDEYAEDIAIVFWCTFISKTPEQTESGQWEFSTARGYYQNRMFNGLFPMTFRSTTTGAQQIADWLNAIPSTYYNGIISATLIPRASILYADATLEDYFIDISKQDHFASIRRRDGRAPKNNKLYTYPYNMLYVTCFNGVNATYQYEYFNTPNFPDTCQFNIVGDLSPDPSQCAIPLYYKGVNINGDEMITLTGFPQVSWNTDSFKAWLAQNASNIASIALGLAAGSPMLSIGGLTGMGASGIPTAPQAALPAAATSPVPVQPSGDISFTAPRSAAPQANMTGIGEALEVQSVVASLPNVLNTLIGGVKAAMTPPQARGNNGKYLMHKAILDHLGFYCKHIRPEYVTIIDDFFSMYGYATHEVKKPNIEGRMFWNYVKTIGITVDGLGIPEPFIQQMNSAFNRGITFWHFDNSLGIRDFVGNYANLNNSIVS